MIKVKAKIYPSGEYKLLEIYGHAQYAEYGKDIVCAGVSALAETAVLGLEKIAGIKPKLKKQEGYFVLRLPKNMSSEEALKASLILETIFLGLEDIAKSYPSNIQTEKIEEVY